MHELKAFFDDLFPAGGRILSYIEDLIPEPRVEGEPTWFREAKERGIDYIVVIYEKAEGFVFCPSNLEKPFRVGGDYDGNFPTDAQGALKHYETYFNKAFVDRVQWFIPYVRKVADGVDFSLEDLNLESRKVRIIEGAWPW